MNRKIVKAVALGLGGLAVALLLTVGAFAIAGQEISEPAGPPVFTTPGPGASEADTSHSPEPGRTESPSPSDDHGGDSGGSATQGDSDGSDGSGEGGSSGSDNSGSGSDNSGSGSDSSGSGSGENEHEDD